MEVKQFVVSLCERKEIKDFIELWHYSHNINGLKCSYCFKLEHEGSVIGAMIYGRLAMRNQYKKYVEHEDDVIELRRLVCIDETPRNTESFFIGKTLKWLEKNTSLKCVLSYADATYNHTGVIYQASNFACLGKTLPGKMILYQGKLYHDKTIRTKYNGKLKPYCQRIKDSLASGESYYVPTQGKYIYLYDLRHHPKHVQGKYNNEN